MDETSKTKKIWGPLELKILQGSGIDIGCGPDPVFPDVRQFDIKDGDANHITQFVHEQFDYVYASHCLEHMRDPRQAVLEWWQLVKTGGHLFFIVPDEDLYEQGVFPSRFNPDHKATFTISKSQSWSPASVNVLDLARSLPGGDLVSLTLQDRGYDRSLLRHGADTPTRWIIRFFIRVYEKAKRNAFPKINAIERLKSRFLTIDQTQTSYNASSASRPADVQFPAIPADYPCTCKCAGSC
jgi:SAM-dependent methyltransferase